MAYFKVFSGQEANLPTALNPGAMYFTTDTYRLFVDLPEERVLISTGEPVSLYPEKEEGETENPDKEENQESGDLIIDTNEYRDVYNNTYRLNFLQKDSSSQI